MTGSSPLARGLPLGQGGDRGEDGIIPARAGFTPDFVKDAIYTPGSSPLARGLQETVLAVYGGEGIIPARAGFTG